MQSDPFRLNNQSDQYITYYSQKSASQFVGNKFHLALPKEEITGLPRSPIPGNIHLAATPEKSGISYPSKSGLGLYFKLN